ncbi:MAG: hypothetical protein ACW99L_17275 [Promethearchaeota archaeon]|jgi:hypothetical protein
MTQSVLKEEIPFEIDELFKNQLKKYLATVREDKESVKEQYELFEILNPRYFEEGIPLKEALEKPYQSDIRFSSQFNIFRGFGY